MKGRRKEEISKRTGYKGIQKKVKKEEKKIREKGIIRTNQEKIKRKEYKGNRKRRGMEENKKTIYEILAFKD